METIPNRTSGKIELTPPACSHTIVLLVSSLNFGLLTQTLDIASQDTCQCLKPPFEPFTSPWIHPCYNQLCCFFEQPKRPHCWLCFILGISTVPPGWFLSSTSTLPQFWTVTFSRQSIPHRPPNENTHCHPPNENIPDTTSHVQPSIFISYLAGTSVSSH